MPSLRTRLHKHMRTSFRQILPQTALKILAGRKPACGFLPTLQQNYARKSALISYEDRFLISAGEPTINVSVFSVKSTIMPTEAISTQCSKKFIIKVYSLPYKVVFQIIILGNFPVLTRCDPCSFFEYLHKAYLISVSAEVGYFLNGHIGGRKIILSCLDLCG